MSPLAAERQAADWTSGEAEHVDRARAIRSWPYGTALILCGCAVGGLVWPLDQWDIALAWLSASLVVVGLAYLWPTAAVFGKHGRHLCRVRRVLFAPFLLVVGAIWHATRTLSAEPPHGRITQHIFIGRRLLPAEYPEVRTVVDCTAEFDEYLPTGIEYVPFLLLDGLAAHPDSLRDVARRICSATPPVYIHCAKGHARSAMVAAAVLLECGHVNTVERAIECVRAARPRARPNASQVRALRRAFEVGSQQAAAADERRAREGRRR